MVGEKQVLRKRIWDNMEKQKIAIFPLPCKGRIPNFKGALQAAMNLKKIEEYQQSKIIFSSPDSAQFHVRRLALLDGKTVVVASPRLKSGFLIIEPKSVAGKERNASTIRGSFKYGTKLKNIPNVDFAVQGCVAVDKAGNRLGKGGGYGDREIKMIRAKENMVKVAVTCHSSQVVDSVPVEEKDEKVDLIITERDIILCKSY
ncbi:MAG: 5-formyltetrahydrofolate cyclo-ligase [Candidatus Hodarchaeota archaeon]